MVRPGVVAIALAACGSKPEPKPAPEPAPSPKQAPPPVDAPAIASTPPITIDRPGSVFVLAHGVFAIGEDGTVTTLDRRDGTWSKLAVDRRARPWIWESTLKGERSILAVYDGMMRHAVVTWNTVRASALASASDGGVRVLDDKFLTHATGREQPARRVRPRQRRGALVQHGTRQRARSRRDQRDRRRRPTLGRSRWRHRRPVR